MARNILIPTDGSEVPTRVSLVDEWIAPAVGSGWIPVVRRYAHQWQGSADSRRYRGQGLSVAPGTPIKDLVSVGLGGSTFPSSLAQAVEHVGVIFQPVPGHALADIHLERRRRDRDGLL